MPDATITQTPNGRGSDAPSVLEAYSPAFFALAATRVTDLILTEGSDAARQQGIDVPARSMSTMLSLLASPKGVTELARELSVTHVAIIKTTRALSEMGYVKAGRDPADARRRPLELTAKGRKAAADVERFMAAAQIAFTDLFEEIGVNAETVMLNLEQALKRESFQDRMQSAYRR